MTERSLEGETPRQEKVQDDGIEPRHGIPPGHG